MLPIILAINNAEERSFVEQIYDKHKNKIYRIAFDILHNPEDAEDCLQNVFQTIIDNLDMFKSAEHYAFIKLIVTCTRNEAIDIYRKNKRRNKFETQFNVYWDDDSECSDIEDIADNNITIDSMLINVENQKRISEMIEALKPIYRDVFQLRYKYSISNQDIARILKISEGAVKVRYLRAKKMLLQKWEEELNEMRKNG